MAVRRVIRNETRSTRPTEAEKYAEALDAVNRAQYWLLEIHKNGSLVPTTFELNITLIALMQVKRQLKTVVSAGEVRNRIPDESH